MEPPFAAPDIAPPEAAPSNDGSPDAAVSDAAARVDALFARWSAPESPGCAIGVSRNGRTLLSRAYGMANLEHDVPNTPGTVFEAGSASKQFTAAAIVLLARQGALALGDDVRRYVPEVPDYGATITLRHLLHHTSGLRDWGSVMNLAGRPRGTRIYTHAHALDVIGRQRALNFTPGAEFSYTNTGYNLLAIIAERVSGERLAGFTRRELFEPLGMTRTEWRDDFMRTVRGRASAYAPAKDGWRLLMPMENVYGNAGLLTTTDDLLRWNHALDSGAIPGLDVLWTPGALSDGRTIEYGMGLFVDRHRGVRQVAHGGATAGYRAYLARYPDAGLSLALLCNAGNMERALALRVAEIFLEDRLQPEADPAPPAAVPVDAAELKRRAGLYRSRRTGAPLRLAVEDGALRSADGAELIPIGPSVFSMGRDARVEFGEESDSLARVVYADGDAVTFEPAAPADTRAEALAAYAGEYHSDEAEATYTAAVADGRLELRMRPSTTIPLAPAYADGFTAPGAAVVRFIRGADGCVRAMTIGTERVRALRFDRVGG